MIAAKINIEKITSAFMFIFCLLIACFSFHSKIKKAAAILCNSSQDNSAIFARPAEQCSCLRQLTFKLNVYYNNFEVNKLDWVFLGYRKKVTIDSIAGKIIL